MTKFGTTSLPNIVSQDRRKRRIVTERVHPGGSIAYRDDLGGLGDEIIVRGEIKDDIVSTLSTLKGLVDGVHRTLDLQDGSSQLIALAGDPSFRRVAPYEKRTYEIRFRGFEASFSRVSTGKVEFDDFNDESLDAEWTYEEGSAGNTGTEQNDRYEIVAAAESYAHIQRLIGADNVVVIAKFQAAVKGAATATWAGAIKFWFKAYNWYSLMVNTSSMKFRRELNANGTTDADDSTVAMALATWYWLKIVVSNSQVKAYYSTDGSSWTLLFTDSRPASWAINASSLIALGCGYEQSVSAYPNLDFDNNYSALGANNTWYFDQFILMRSESITVELPDGWTFDLYKGAVKLGSSSAASGGIATLDISPYINNLPFDSIQILDAIGTLVTTVAHASDIWGGDHFSPEET